MIDNKNKYLRRDICAESDSKYYKLVLNKLFGSASLNEMEAKHERT